MLDKSYCYKECDKGKLFLKKLLAEKESVFEVASIFNDFVFNCSCINCPAKCKRAELNWKNNIVGQTPILIKNYIKANTYNNFILGDILSINEYRDNIKNKTFIPYDGYGYYCTDEIISTEKSHYDIKDIDKAIQRGYTQVIWYNK